MDIRWDLGKGAPGDWSGRAEAINGRILGVAPLDFGLDDAVLPDKSWRCHWETLEAP